VVTLLAFILLTFLLATPPGLLSKADMIGYAVCGQIESHSFIIAGRRLPLCARCTGTFLGALLGILGQILLTRRRRAAEFPPPTIIAILIGFVVLMGLDGLNSYLTLFPGGHNLYQPRNWLRLTSGALNGLAMSALIYPAFSLTLLLSPAPQRVIRNFRDLGILLLIEASLVVLVLGQWPFLLYPLALLSAAGVLTLLTLVNSTLVVVLVRRENTVSARRGAIIPLLAGLAASLVQIGLIDMARYMLTGTLSGIPPLQ
jgi:uncharacterized membrane protein